jgi:hypothetical protein
MRYGVDTLPHVRYVGGGQSQVEKSASEKEKERAKKKISDLKPNWLGRKKNRAHEIQTYFLFRSCCRGTLSASGNRTRLSQLALLFISYISSEMRRS